MTRSPACLLGFCLVAAVLACSFARSSEAVDLQPGQVYPGGTTLSASNAGITTTVPKGWQATMPFGSETLVFERADQAAYVFALADRWTQADALVQMGASIPLGDGIVFDPASPATIRTGGIVTASYHVRGAERPGKGAIWTRIGPHGVGIAFFAVDFGEDGGDAGDADARKTAERLAIEVQFAAPLSPKSDAASGAATTTDTTGSAGSSGLTWQDYMRGRYLARFYSDSGSQEEKSEIWLCSDGSFRRASDGAGQGGGASGAFEGGGQGHWSASGIQPGPGELRLESQDGVSTHRVALEGGKLTLDGSPWLRGDNEVCH